MNSTMAGAVAVIACTSSPPGRRSRARTSVLKPSGAHQDSMPSGVVHSRQTVAAEGGEWRSRRMGSVLVRASNIVVQENICQEEYDVAMEEVPEILAALAEPNRRRIVELLDAAPRSVGEVADALALRQPQATKHLQALERAGLVTVHPLGRRRIYALRREPLRGLRSWLERFDGDHPSEDVLVRYQQAVAAEQRRSDAAAPRTLVFARDLPGTPAAAWR